MFQKTTLPLHAVPSEVSSLKHHSNLTLSEIQSDNISKVAEKHFTGASFDPNVVENIYTNELEASQFSLHKLMLLEFNHYLEKYLWPHYSEKASVHHVLSICLMMNEKARQHLSVWDAFDKDDREKFSSLFTRVIQLMNTDLDLFLTRQLLTFIILCFQSFENDLARTESLKLVTIGIWTHLAHEAKREQLFESYPNLAKLWRSSQKKFKAADKDTQAQLTLERNWLSQQLHRFIQLVYQIPETGEVDRQLIYLCERYLEFFIDLEAQLPTRRFFNTLLDDHQIVVLSQLAPFNQSQDNRQLDLLKKLLSTLSFYAKFEINDQTGVALTDLEMTEAHCQRLLSLQRTVFRFFRDEIIEFPLANLGSIETRQDLLWHLEPLSEETLSRLCQALAIRASPIITEVNTKQHLIHVLIDRYQKRTSQIEKINSQPLYPDETTLFDDQLIQSQFYAGDRPLALPKLNLQFLTLHDYLLRHFTLYRLESAYEIRQDIEDVVKRLAPRLTYPDRKTEFAGWARMAVSIDEMAIVEVGQPNLGEEKPSFVQADIQFQVGRFTQSIRQEWDALRKHDVLFLVSIEATETSTEKLKEDEDFREHYGIRSIRGCEIVEIIGYDDKPMDPQTKSTKWKGANRKIRVALDTCQYKMDTKQSSDLYSSFNILVRRKPQENNFKAVLETIRDLMQTDLTVPDWLQRVLLGYGDPSSAHYSNMPQREPTIDFRDTFLDWQHLKDSFPNKTLVEAIDQDNNNQLEPPFTVSWIEDQEKSKQHKKRETLEIASYQPPSMGPYPQDKPKKNQIRFTPLQIESIYAGLNHGLSLVVGPPGTGKTDVAVQTIVNLYHNHPDQHTLIVTHSNQALNQIFEKLIELDIDPRHVVRLGHGEEELKSELNFSKHGRVASALERRLLLLSQVDRLSQSLGMVGEHGATCETATYFYHVHVLPRWEDFLSQSVSTAQEISQAFPFGGYFADIQPIFSDTMTANEAMISAKGCFRHLEAIFSELEAIRPFELLRSGTDRANYLLTKEAKIVAMTCTHAALKRRELIDLDFRYDNIVIEEAAQIYEIETFIPLLLQRPNEEGKSRLKRVMLIGDHHQLPPVVKNAAFQKYGNMEQSMFARFVRLGVPTLQLDQQGRARPSLAKLYNWRYDLLGDLERVQVEEYTRANAGFRYDCQLIDVDQAESEPVPFFYQNLGEAEYVVAVYQYMRLMGYPAETIAILTTYNGQKALIEDVLEKRCGWNPYFGKPVVNTVDRYQGQQNDYILLSLVRTKTVGHIRDIRRLIVAMSRARLGLYVFCHKRLFENCYELKPVFEQLNERPSQLCLLPNEKYPVERLLDDEVHGVTVQDVEEMGKLVYRQSQEQLEWMRQQEADRLAANNTSDMEE